MNGMMTNFRFSEQGCWYATTTRIPAHFATEKKERAEHADSSGAAKA
jgi:hypothetical protein